MPECIEAVPSYKQKPSLRILPSVIGSPGKYSLDDLVGAGEERGRDGKAEGLRRFEINRQFNLGRKFDREVAGPRLVSV